MLCYAKLLQSCLTLCEPMDCSLPGSSVHEILQARILEWVAMPSSRRTSSPRNRTPVSYGSCTGGWVLYHCLHLGSPESLPQLAPSKDCLSCRMPSHPRSCLLWWWCCCSVTKSCLTLCDPMDCSPQAPLYMRFFRQEYWSGLPCPPPEDLLDPGIEPRSPTLQADSLSSEPSGKPWVSVNWLQGVPAP